MPILFRCPGCGNLLRTPDESQGKKARCPQCGTIAEVPQGPDSLADDAADRGFLAPATAPLREDSWTAPDGLSNAPPQGGSPGKEPEGINPYAAPAPLEREPPSTALGSLAHQRATMQQLLVASWRIFTNHLGPVLLLGLIVLAVNMTLQIASGVSGFAAEATGEPVVVIGLQLLNMAVGFFAQTWVNLGITISMLNLARTGRATPNDFFAVGAYYGRALGVMAVIAVVLMGVAIGCMVPFLIVGAVLGGDALVLAAAIGAAIAALVASVVYLRYYLSLCFLVDHNTRVFDSLRLSVRYMQGNKLSVFAATAAAGVLAVLFGVVTCCLGFLALALLGAPYFGLLKSLAYLIATGQSHEGEVKSGASPAVKGEGSVASDEEGAASF